MPAISSRFISIGTVTGIAVGSTVSLADSSSFDRSDTATALDTHMLDNLALESHCRCYIADNSHSLYLQSCYNFGCSGACRHLALRFLALVCWSPHQQAS